MAFWDKFRRNQKVILPEEVGEYYQSQKRERVGVAVILGVVALVITLVVASALFFGGRFIYRKIKGDSKPAPISIQQPGQQVESGDLSGNGVGPQTSSTSTNTPSQSGTAAQPTAPLPSSAQSTTPAMPSTGDLPRTGDEGL